MSSLFTRTSFEHFHFYLYPTHFQKKHAGLTTLQRAPCSGLEGNFFWMLARTQISYFSASSFGVWFLLPGKRRRRRGQQVVREVLAAFLLLSPLRAGDKSDAPATPSSLAHTLPSLLICNILSLTHSCFKSGVSRLRGRDASAVPTLGPGRELPKPEPSARHSAIHPQKNRAIAFAALQANAETLERFNSLNLPRVMETLSSPL